MSSPSGDMTSPDGGATGGGSTSPPSGSTSGGSMSGGGGTTQGGGTTAGQTGGSSEDGSMSDPTVTTGTSGSGVLGGESVGRGPGRASSGIVRLRDVVRDNRYVVRLRLDADRLAARGLQTANVVAGLTALQIGIEEDPEDGHGLTWLASFAGPRPPLAQEVAGTSVPLGPGRRNRAARRPPR